MNHLQLFSIAMLLAIFSACHHQPTSGEHNDPPPITTTATNPIQEIKDAFTAIESRLNTLEKKTLNIEVEGIPYPVELTAFYDNNIPVKLIRTDAGGHSSQTTVYYLKDGKLFFIYDTNYEEASINGPFTTQELRIYINQGNIIQILEKEKTYNDQVDMSNVPNEDVTNTKTDKAGMLKQYTQVYQESIAHFNNTTTTSFSDGRWISVDDPQSGIEIKDGKWMMFYKGTPTNPNSIFEAIIRTPNNPQNNILLTLSNSSSVMEYEIAQYNEEILQLIYLDRGNTLTYKKQN